MNDFRKNLVEEFIKSLQEDKEDWTAMWSRAGRPINGNTNRPYHGVNQFWLAHIARSNDWDDPRWFTFKQASDKGWRIRKGSKSTRVEYWMPYDLVNKRPLTWERYRELQEDPNFDPKQYTLTSRFFSVFNGKQIEGIPEYVLKTNREVEANTIIERISTEMGVPIFHDGQDRAYYIPSKDEIHLPIPERFFDQYAYNATALHELSHATGHSSRLNRAMSTLFGGDAYAYEELVAEISSAFCSDIVGVSADPIHVNNHKAYIQSWIEGLKNEPEVLFKAIKDAERAADYIEEKGGLLMDKEKMVDAVEELSGRYTAEKEPTLDTFIKDWYMRVFPSDDLGKEISGLIRFEDLRDFLFTKGFTKSVGTDIYDFFNIRDSLIRERVFEGLSKVSGISYEDIYEKWLAEDLTPMKEEKIKVVSLKPDQVAEVIEIENTLEAMQEFVGGLIQVIQPWDDGAIIVCNDEGKLMGLPLNRGLFGEDGSLWDILAGNVFIAYAPPYSEDFESLPKELQDKYLGMFRDPEMFVQTQSGIKAIPYTPGEAEIHDRFIKTK